MYNYFLVEEFFGIRVYDIQARSEFFFDKRAAVGIRELLKGKYKEIIHNGTDLGAPLKISMNLTKMCNLRCEQCFSNSGELCGQELTTHQIFELFDQMIKNGTFFICLGGGEPFMRPDLYDILSYGKEKGLAISVVSNGTLFTPEIIARLDTLNIDTLWVSFDGLKDNHERLRGKGTYEKAVAALNLMHNARNFKKAMRVSLNKYNINEYKELIKLAEEYNLDILRFTPLLSFGRAQDKDLTISQQQYISFLREIKLIKSKVKIIHPESTNDAKFWISKENFGCHCGKEAVWIDEEGNYSPCFFWGEKYTVGNIKTSSYADLWRESLKKSKLCGNDVCKECNHYQKCRGGCRARSLFEYNDLNLVDPLCPLGKNKPMK